ncbi:hypothetical protein A2U01_0036181 [Trifolium medium]|uniref:Uncharacterized protein n=1 Tax=Trifolium medium TaxID=97028 RepID=A0A392PUQ8_9FABA|nr:hypothetical protein [Trifolium medium]
MVEVVCFKFGCLYMLVAWVGLACLCVFKSGSSEMGADSHCCRFHHFADGLWLALDFLARNGCSCLLSSIKLFSSLLSIVTFKIAFLHVPTGYGHGATRTAVRRNTLCISVPFFFLLVPAQRARVDGATCSVELLRAVWLSGSGAMRRVVLRNAPCISPKVDFC